ncbi:uncharacterized protein BCR38DRAFT_425416 [Pseudomassariella vexata]|uniref:C2H2-type domain-containing protein n=1 Tax=Pseudomassariella vexata TaxID=1141098 RepID=A0A1Y2E801_9PEZI|nr:uncharacterized protein BCR38DRAFT_425416 [Pseudomassariella vexata]ORY66975.1 hypothetical protein BCR38DRAFT_425416 [Pseudomassariella vexata]
MDLDTVGGLVQALVSTYYWGLELYTKWQQRRWQQNHYRTHEGKLPGTGSCALSTSLSTSGLKIREMFDIKAEMLGTGFSLGDEQCRALLRANLEQLESRVRILQDAIEARNQPLELFEAIRVSEAVRISSLTALTKQYQRAAIGRLVPRKLPTRQQSTPTPPPLSDADVLPSVGGDRDARTPVDHDAQTTCHTASSSKSPFKTEPPSPPPTPKFIPDDLQSTCTSEFGPRPKNSVFSIFCPEAMKRQVDLRMSVPRERKCIRCDYEWRGHKTEDRQATMVKDGFQLTPRFLGKSHFQGGFGCVLCISSGKTEEYETVENLRDHINAAHNKWQMLHDRDLHMAGR